MDGSRSSSSVDHVVDVNLLLPDLGDKPNQSESFLKQKFGGQKSMYRSFQGLKNGHEFCMTKDSKAYCYNSDALINWKSAFLKHGNWHLLADI